MRVRARAYKVHALNWNIWQ